MKIIGISGELESGKSTVAKYLVNDYGYKEYSFADNLKQMCMKSFALTYEQCYTSKGKAEQLKSKRILSNFPMMEILCWVNIENKWDGPIDYDKIHKILHRGETFSTARQILQYVGTEVCRECFLDNFHVKVLFDQISREKYSKIVISDARFPNERRYIKNNKGIVVKTKDPNQEHKSSSNHASESNLGVDDDYDFVFNNDKTKPITDLEDQIKRCAAEFNLERM